MSRRTVIITGATKGLGRAIAIACGHAGHRIIGLYASDGAAAQLLRADLEAIAPDSVVIKHDVREEGTLWNSPEILQSQRLVLINNACAPFKPQPFHLTRWEEVQSGLDVGLKGSWLCAQGVLRPMMRAGGGSIVNVLSAVIHGTPPKGFAAYAAAKHAIRGLTLALASEYAAKGIRVFSVSPGFMSTSLTKQWDARFIESMITGDAAVDPERKARRIVELLDDSTAPGKGEDYLI